MKIRILEWLFFSCWLIAVPYPAGADILSPVIAGQHVFTSGTLSGSETAKPMQMAKKFVHWKSHTFNLIKQLFQKRKSPGGQRGWLILAVVLLSILAFIFLLYGGFALVVAAIISSLGDSTGTIIGIVFLGLLFLALGAGCIVIIKRIARKLRRLKHAGETPVQTFPKRPPSKNEKDN